MSNSRTRSAREGDTEVEPERGGAGKDAPTASMFALNWRVNEGHDN